MTTATESIIEIPITVVNSSEEAFYTTKTGEQFTVIYLKADATGGFFSTKTDPKNGYWSAPSNKKIIKYDAKILDKGGDYKFYAKLVSDHRVEANVWAKGHPKGEANNHSWVEMEIVVFVENRS